MCLPFGVSRPDRVRLVTGRTVAQNITFRNKQPPALCLPGHGRCCGATLVARLAQEIAAV